MGVILSIPSLVSPLLTPTNGIVLISQTGLIHLVSSLSKKLVQDTYQKQSLKTLVRIREMVGEARFDRFLEGFHPQCKKDFDILCQVYDVRMNLGDSGIDLHVPLPGEDLLFEGNGSNSGHGYWYDGSTSAAYPTAVSPEDAVFRDLNQNVVILDDKSSSSENMADSPLSLKDDGADGVGSISHLTGTVTENSGRDNVHGRGEVMGNGHRNYRDVYSEQTSGIKGVSSDRSYTENREEHLEVAIEERSAPLSENKDSEEKSVTVIEGEPLEEGTVNFSRVVLETEFKLNEDAAIMMTILEEGNTSPQEELCSDETGTVNHGEEFAEDKETGADDEGYRMYNNNFIMKVLTDDEDYNDDDDVAVPDEFTRRTPRRVRFGGEVVMMRTPDSEETAILQQNGDSLSQDDVNEGCSESENGAVEEITADGTIEAVIPDARRESTVCSKDNSSHESISYARSGSRGQSAAQEKLDHAKRNMSEEDSRRDSLAFVRQGTLTEIKQNSEDGAREDTCERSLRESVQEAKQDSVENLPSGPDGDEITKSSVEGSLGDTRCSPNEACKKDSVKSGRILAQHATRKLCGSTDAARQDSAENVGQETTEDTEQGSTEERVRDVTAADDVGQKDEEMSSSLQSHIPLPVIPARSKPKDRKRRGSLHRKRQSMRDSETSTDTQQQSSDLAGGTRLKQGSEESVNGAENDGRASTLWAPEESDWRGAEHEYNDQNWEELGIVTKSVLDDLHDQEEWVSRVHGIESLSAALRDPEVLQTIGPSLPSILHCLLVTMAEDRNHRVATTSISALRGLIASLPRSVLEDHLPQIVFGLARHIGGSGSVNLKIETVQVAKQLMQIMKPNPVIEVLLTSDCIGAKSSKMRENSLLFLIYATLTFPSTEFRWDEMTGRVAAAVADPRRRVRQAALDALAVIAQFATHSLLDEAVKAVAEKQPSLATRIAYLAGIQARLSRRQLPTTSPDGLILYVLQIPSARVSSNGGLSSNPMGSDVDWVLAGSGSLSSGSARSRGQLVAAQRLDPQGTLFPKADDTSVTRIKKGNPWTERKEVVAPGFGAHVHSAGQQRIVPINPEKSSDEQRPRVGVSSWTTDLDTSQNGILSSRDTFRPLYLQFQSPPDVGNLNNDSVEKGSFSLLPNRLSPSMLTSPGSEGVALEKLNQTWPPPSSGHHSPRIPKTSSKRGRRILEPLNSCNPHDGVSHREISPARRVSPACRGISPVPIAVSPTPKTVLPMPMAISPKPNSTSPMRAGVNSGGRHKIPPLSPHRKLDRVVDSDVTITFNSRSYDTSIRKPRRRKRSTNKGKGIVAIEHEPLQIKEDEVELSSGIKDAAGDTCTIPQKPMLARQGGRHDMSSAGMYYENGSKISNGLFTPPAEPFLPAVDPSTPKLSRAKRSPHQQQDELEFKSLDENDEAWKNDSLAYTEREQLESITVSPSVPSAPVINESTTTTKVIQLDTKNQGSVPSLHNLQHSPPLLSHAENADNVNNDNQGSQPTCNTGSVIDLHLEVEDSLQKSMSVAPLKQMRNVKRPVGAKIPATTPRIMQFHDSTCTKLNSGLFPDTSYPVDKPKEALQQCFIHLSSSEWEVTMQGLQLLVRLMRHHPETIRTQLHSVIVAVGKQVRNLRSQVARAACQASGELFLSQKRALETDLDELACPLLHRTADTNKFLRADSNAALDKMIEVISPSKAVAVIVGKGISHQNAIVRTSCARLLVSLVNRIGVDKVMAHPGDIRDKILISGSNLLTEGSLDTRCFAKQLFRMLSSYPTFNSVMSEVIPSHVLRNISKTLQNLK
ncbi:uncharacterized protein LOC111872178 isoform X2 [Cryptotermes secundus]|uniref:uncharacterized protein LOC111872178 isoform X2 n=1 Tax=Cryptotermes secundus TaxID=105785 RepID=UPI001454D900|nr:uncharacterized protein LOC111872178 isoform X2 [Cryptotermes secundus]